MYASLGTKVSVVELLDGLLMGADRDLVVLHKRMEKLFNKRIYLNTKVGSLSKSAIKSKSLLKALASTGTSNSIACWSASADARSVAESGLENTRVQLDAQGFAICDSQQLRTTDPHILRYRRSVAGGRCWPTKRLTKAKWRSKFCLGRCHL
ncbi:MAG: hypothetical protein R3C56_02315 [Pirellulaceae bacterium]